MVQAFSFPQAFPFEAIASKGTFKQLLESCLLKKEKAAEVTGPMNYSYKKLGD